MFFRTFGNRLRHAGMDFSNTIRSKLLPALAAFALFFVVSAAYFAPQFRGEALPQHDVIQYEGMAKDISDMRAATGEDPQWTGGMFGGMPAYLINVAYPAQLVKRTVGQVVKIIDTPAGFLFFAMVSMWLMLLIVGINPWVGIVAALAYGLDNGRTQTVMVYDLGGGTFDVSLIRIGDGIVQVLSTCGDNFLGGDDFDERIVNWLADRCRAEHGVDLTNDRVAMQRLREEAEKAKKELSSAKQTDINLPFLTMAADGALHLQTTLTRAKFEELCADLIERTALPVRNALSDARLSASDLDQVLLVGGSTRIPAVQAKVMRMTGLEPSKSLNPDECVALGAAVQAGRLGGEMLSGPGEDLLLMDVTPLTLSIETVGGVATHLIERNSTIPTRFSKVFTTAAPFQKTVQIKVLQGEREFARDNKLLGTFTLRGIKRAWAGVPKIEVTFDIDANGIVKVKARDMDTGKQQSITISGTSNLTEDEIKRAKENAAAFAGQDKERKAALEALNAGEAALYRVNTALGSKAGKALDRETRTKIKEAERTLERVLKHKKADKLTPVDVNAINTAREALSAVAAPLVARWESEKA